MKPALPSDRSFGLTFAVVFGLVTAWLVYRGIDVWIWTLGVAAGFAVLALIYPRVLHPLNVAWMWFGALLHRIVSPIILGVIFFGLFAPIAIVFRLRGRDVLNRKFEPAATSYWTARLPPGPDAERSFPRQY
jgi:hypothetical protein